MSYLRLALLPRYAPLTLSAVVAIVSALGLFLLPQNPVLIATLCIGGALTLLGFRDLIQKRHAVLRNYPISAHLRFLLESIRPEMRQYFFEDDKHGMPFSRDKRAVVYQRAKMQLDKRPFGTNYDVYAPGFEWVNHSMSPKHIANTDFRVTVGGPDCEKPYSCSIFNISAMSFGALSPNAIKALNNGAKAGKFAHDTGEGGFSPYHREGGGDIIWEIGSGYFGCRNLDGTFNGEKFADVAANEQIKMVELKLSQGAKPGHGGVLPGAKVNEEISLTRGVPVGHDCISPSHHSAFSTPVEMMQFIGEIKRLSGGKPAGFKLCVGHEWEFLAICKAMLKTGIYPDFIVIDGTEGGTGAAHLVEIDDGSDHAFFGAIEFGNLLAAVIGDERRAVENLTRLVTDPIGRNHRHDVGHRVADHSPLPQVFSVELGIVGLRADGGGIEQHFGALEHHRARGFGEPLIPADADAHGAELRLPRLEAGVAGTEIELFLVARTIGDMALAIGAHESAIGIDHDEAVVEMMILALEDRGRDDDAELFGQRGHMRDRGMNIGGEGRVEMMFFLFAAEIVPLEQFRRQNHLRALLGRVGHEAFDARDILLHVGGEGALDRRDGHFGHGRFL